MNYTEADKVTNVLDKAYNKVLKEQYDLALKNIQKEVESYYTKYSVDGKLNLEIMSVADRNKVTRLQKLNNSIVEELNSLNRGRPQQLASHLTNVYVDNYDLSNKEIEKLVSLGLDKVDRQTIYQSAVSPLGKIGLTSNANAVKTSIQRAITQSIVKGDGIREMSSSIKKELETNANNAVRIARTETNRIVNQAREDLLVNASKKGIKVQKEWVSTFDSRVRDSHLSMDGVRVNIDEPFIVNGFKMMKPSDSSLGAPPSEVINCRCAVVGFLPEYETEQDIKDAKTRKYQADSIVFYKKEVAFEPKVTTLMKDLSKQTSQPLSGLKFRVKTKDSYLEKVTIGGTPTNPYQVKDSVRYTMLSSGNDIANNIEKTLPLIKDKGYEVVKIKNYFTDKNEAYQGVNVTFKDQKGLFFELQFHTEQSLELKEKYLHPIYEKTRTMLHTDAEYIRLTEKAFEYSSKVDIPKNIDRIKSVIK